MSTDFIDGIGYITNIFPKWAAIFIGIAIIILLLICVSRARSFYFLLDRTWLFFGGSKEFHNQSLNDEWNLIRDLELYRYRYGFPFHSLKEIEILREWLKNNNINLTDIRRIYNLFDFSKFELKQKSFKLEKMFTWAMFFVLLVIMLVGLGAAFKDDKYFVVVETEKKFIFDGKKILIDDSIFDKKHCDKIKGTPYPDSELEKDVFNKYMACSFFSKDGKDFYNKTVWKQWVLFLFVFVVCVLYLIHSLFLHAKYNLALRINEKIERNKDADKNGVNMENI